MSEKNLKEITYSGEFVNELESKIEYLKEENLYGLLLIDLFLKARSSHELDALTYFSILKPTNNSSVMALLQSHSPSFPKNKSMKR